MSSSVTSGQDALVALALLKTNWEVDGRSYIDNFNILTAECLRRSDSNVVSAPEVHDAFKRHFGLNLPLNTVDVLLRRAAKRQWVQLDHGVYKINRARLNDVNFGEQYSRAIDAQDRLTSELQRFAKEKFGLTWTTQDAELAVTRYLSEETVTFLRAAATRSLVPLPRRAAKSQKFVLASFVNGLVADDSPIFESLRTVAEGNMLATGMFLSERAEAAPRRFAATKLFFDTKFLLSALGHAGASMRAPNIEVLKLASDAGAHLRCFTHTLDEVRAVLNGCSRNLAAGSSVAGYGPVYDHFLSAGASSSDVMLAATTVESDLRKLGVEVVTPPEGKYEYVLDESALEAAIRQRVNYLNENALIRDIASVAAVVKMRGDSQPRYLETADAVFVTPNRPLVEAVRDFIHADNTYDQVSVAITDGDLTNLLWLKRPVVAPDLPRRRLVALCYAALQPSDEFRHRYLAEIDKLLRTGEFSERDVFMLRHSIEARRIAMDLTVGDDTAFTMGTVSEVLRVLQRQIRDEEAKRAAEANARADAADTRSEDTLRRLDGERQSALERQARRDERVARCARAMGWGAAGVLAAVLGVAVYISIPEVPSPWPVPRSVRVAAATIAAVLTLLTALAPITVFDTVRARLERSVGMQLRRMSAWFAGE